MPDNLNELRHIEGFPLGEDADILTLSDPPYYTAYPNPHIAEFIAQHGKVYDEATDDYHREPFVGDVSVGKSDRIYKVHSYHTKVPHLAIKQFIEYYTNPGDVVLDCFAGTGMTGVAAQLANRKCVLVELSPFASSIATSLNASCGLDSLAGDAQTIIKDVERQCGHLFRAKVGQKEFPLAYCVWSAHVACPYCDAGFSIWDVTVDEVHWTEADDFRCPECKAILTYPECHKANNGHGFTRFDLVRVVIVQGRKYLERRPTPDDLERIRQAETLPIAYWYPDNEVGDGEKLSEPKNAHGLSRMSQFFTVRTLHVLSQIWYEIHSNKNRKLKGVFTATLRRVTKMNRYMAKHKLNRSRELVGPLDKTAHIPSIFFEANPLLYFTAKATEYARLKLPSGELVRISTQSATDMRNVPSNCIDYIFVDPPFGANIQYSELNSINESWFRVFTNAENEAIISTFKNKREDKYRALMTRAFSELYRVLKPNRWMTVEFHSSAAAIWNLIQESLAKAGFVVAQVAVLDKQKGTINQLTSPSSVNNDLVISAYKPRASFERRFLSQAGRGLEVEFVRQHLEQLPIAANVERSREMLYSKYLAYYVQHGYQIAYNGEQFYRALAQWGLVERDGYWFADEAQANEYEKRKIGAKRVSSSAQAVLFISDERSARQWLWGFLETRKTYDEIYTAFVKALQTPEDEIPELKTMLEEGFVRTNGNWKRPDALTQAELDAKRQARLLHQFEEYLATARSGGKLAEVRKEALVAGFTEAYRAGRYADILTVGRKLPKRLLEDSPDLFDFVDIAEAKVES
jgi:DNA modification methylase